MGRTRRVLCLTICSLLSMSATGQWTQTNGPYSGDFYTMVNSTLLGTIVAGTSTGCYKSADNGDVWKEVLPYPTYALSGGVFLPIYAGTSDGLYRSTDDGSEWTKVKTLATTSVRAVTLNPSVLFFSTSSMGYRSTDDGTSWDSLSFGSFNSLIILSSYRVVAATRHGIFRSTDNGENWTSVFALGSGQTVEGLARAAHGDLLVIADLNASPFHEVFLRSTDNGLTWTDEVMVPAAIPTMIDAVPNYTFATTAFTYDMPPVPGGIFRSTNDGVSWSRVWQSAGSMSAIVVLTKGVAFAGGGSGVVRSLDTGKTWEAISFPIGQKHSVYSLGVTAGNVYFAGTTDGVFRSTHGGESWECVSTDVVGRTVNSIGVSSADHVFIGTSYYGVLVDNGLFRSTNFGNTWPPCGLGQALTVYSLTAVAEGEIVAGTEENDKQKGGVHYSGKDGTSWTLSRFDSIVFAVATNKAGDIIAGTKGGGVFHSTNQGGTWVPRHPGVNADIRALTMSPNSYWFAGTTDGIMRTTNNGISWTAVNTGLTSLFVRALVVNKAGTLYAGTSGGVFQSTDNGTKWSDYNSGLDIPNILSLAIDSSGYLLAGVRAGGVWRSTEATVGVHDVASIVPDEFSLDQNYPNPFNPSTTIRYGLPHRSHVTMTVFNMLGQRIGLLQNGEQEAGYHDLMFDASGLASGVYMYRIEVRPLDSGVGRDSRSRAGLYVEAKKLLLVR